MSDAERYRLAPLRGVREREETTSRSAFADAVADARARELAVTAAAVRVDEARGWLERALSAPAAVTAFAASLRDRHTARLRGELDRAIAEHERRIAAHREHLGVVDEARQQLATSRARRELIERHFATWRDKRRKLLERRED
jgi:hypothetical protein